LRYRSTFRQTWGECVDRLVEANKLRPGAHIIPVDIVTRWNSTFETVKACIDNELVV
jgi:hypothetical protein